ncbi:MAG: serine hydrolase domain-containing protein [Planctomycetota bacterium]
MLQRAMLFSVLIFSAFLSPHLSGITSARAQETGRNSGGLPQQVDQRVVDFVAAKGIPGLSIAIAKNNQLIWEKGYGLADVENSVAATAETRYRTASIAKSMTAVLILSLAEEGKLELDEDIRTYCPQYPAKKWGVTSRHLLGHLGGVRHYKSNAETRSTTHFFSLNAALETFKDDPLRHEPGSKFLYTTFGYNLLGNVAEGASGQKFLQLLEERVFKPAAMEATVSDDQYAIIASRTRGYMRPDLGTITRLGGLGYMTPGELYNAPLHDTSVKIPGGGLLSSAGDLVRFATALSQGKMLPQTALDEMWTAQTTTDRKSTGYGLGWRVKTKDGEKTVSHTGGQAGTSSILMLHPSSGTAVAIMCNLQSVSLTSIAEEVLELAK